MTPAMIPTLLIKPFIANVYQRKILIILFLGRKIAALTRAWAATPLIVHHITIYRVEIYLK